MRNESEQKIYKNIIYRESNGCKIRILFSDEENSEIKKYVLKNLLEAFEKRVNLPNSLQV